MSSPRGAEGPLPLVTVLLRTEAFFRERGVPSPRLDAELLLAKALGMERIGLYLAHDRPLTESELAALRPMVARRGNREPLSWILGQREFHALTVEVRPGVLDPRPDTETLVEAAMAEIPLEGEEPVFVADVGCGSGAVGLAIAHARPRVRAYCIDIDETAIAVTKANVARLGLGDRVAVLRGDLLEAVPTHRPIDWVVSNPPYVPTGEIARLEPEVAVHEPKRALDGGPDGLMVVARLIHAAAARARQGVLLEIGHDQAARTLDLLRRAGLRDLRTVQDLAGIDRVVGGRVGSAS
ncbi:MAG: peptide chain release factor N(5)-glutamine methyltransferase [Myxococcota bacterium]